jgi:mannose-6-phosphate isomerase
MSWLGRPPRPNPVLYPFTFQPIFKERVWGGRKIEQLYDKQLPPRKLIGESWEISDRPGDASIITNGSFTGKDLRWLMENHGTEILGDAKPSTGNRFPLLCKILDAREKLSLQVHPPASKAIELGGEPKAEVWFIAEAASGAELYVGLKRGVTRAAFEKKIQDGSVAECFHCLPVKAGDAMFLPSGRVHAIGAGLVIFEIQQNSDTTYRAFDWNRVGLDGKPRELHVAESLASIDFNDFEPGLVEGEFRDDPVFKSRLLVDDPPFLAKELRDQTTEFKMQPSLKPTILAVVSGAAAMTDPVSKISIGLKPGQFCLIPACLKGVEISPAPAITLLCAEPN